MGSYSEFDKRIRNWYNGERTGQGIGRFSSLQIGEQCISNCSL
jgi:hypothetical protein